MRALMNVLMMPNKQSFRLFSFVLLLMLLAGSAVMPLHAQGSIFAKGPAVRAWEAAKANGTAKMPPPAAAPARSRAAVAATNRTNRTDGTDTRTVTSIIRVPVPVASASSGASSGASSSSSLVAPGTVGMVPAQAGAVSAAPAPAAADPTSSSALSSSAVVIAVEDDGSVKVNGVRLVPQADGKPLEGAVLLRGGPGGRVPTGFTGGATWVDRGLGIRLDTVKKSAEEPWLVDRVEMSTRGAKEAPDVVFRGVLVLRGVRVDFAEPTLHGPEVLRPQLAPLQKPGELMRWSQDRRNVFMAIGRSELLMNFSASPTDPAAMRLENALLWVK